ncbi:D-alanyl-D-alanine carboxypeptidase [Lactobacillus alvi]|uniref:D-alanyl-D-alanine carboxypeptidase n=1 Tax=Limosilactobacillus alvi TaxID=990412 RepID=A0ABS2EQ78_9LACO|nr:serine hydrolase [Limosilactobacillus alvi]MBM6754380.1 D-alanyl-D-alanine carboxypeptidase [Limosilactobacillus alvi]
MKIIKQTLTIILTFWMVLMAGLVPALATTQTPKFNARATLMVDAQTGQILQEQNADQKLPIASLSKLLTVLVIQDEINHHQLSWQTKVKITPAVGEVANNPEYSNAGLTVGKAYSVKELVTTALIKSADGATLALAGAKGDSTATFNQKLQKKAKQLGVNNATIVNAVGLQNGDLPKSLQVKGVKSSAENMMTASDVAKIASVLVNNEPQLAQIASQPTFTLTGKAGTLATTNKLLTDAAYQVAKVKYTGLKTGTSNAAGYCLATAATYQGRKIITIVLHANGQSDDRFTVTQAMYRWLVRQNLQPQKLALTEDVQNVKVTGGLPTEVNVTAPKLVVWGKQTTSNAAPRMTIKLIKSLARGELLRAPVGANQVIGTVYAQENGIATLDTKGLKAPIETSIPVRQANFFQILWHQIIEDN